MKKLYTLPEVEIVMLGNGSIVTESECDLHCDENCSCHFCVGVCTWDCESDDSTGKFT